MPFSSSLPVLDSFGRLIILLAFGCHVGFAMVPVNVDGRWFDQQIVFTTGDEVKQCLKSYQTDPVPNNLLMVDSCENEQSVWAFEPYDGYVVLRHRSGMCVHMRGSHRPEPGTLLLLHPDHCSGDHGDTKFKFENGQMIGESNVCVSIYKQGEMLQLKMQPEGQPCAEARIVQLTKNGMECSSDADCGNGLVCRQDLMTKFVCQSPPPAPPPPPPAPAEEVLIPLVPIPPPPSLQIPMPDNPAEAWKIGKSIEPDEPNEPIALYGGKTFVNQNGQIVTVYPINFAVVTEGRTMTYYYNDQLIGDGRYEIVEEGDLTFFRIVKYNFILVMDSKNSMGFVPYNFALQGPVMQNAAVPPIAAAAPNPATLDMADNSAVGPSMEQTAVASTPGFVPDTVASQPEVAMPGQAQQQQVVVAPPMPVTVQQSASAIQNPMPGARSPLVTSAGQAMPGTNPQLAGMGGPLA